MQQYIEFAGNHLSLFLGLAAIIGLLAWNLLASRIAGYAKIDPSEAVKMLNRDEAVLLDIREGKEYKDGHIVDSIHIPVTTLGKRHIELAKHKQRPIIVVCRSGSRSTSACSLLRKQGYESIYLLAGGLMSWQSANLPVTRK